MRLSTPSRFTLALTAVLALLLPTSAAQGTDAGPSGSPTGVAGESTPAAARALAAVQAAFGRGPWARSHAPGPADTLDLTLRLRDLRTRLGGLAADDRDTAQAYLARPTQSGEPFGASYGATANPTSDCAETPADASDHFCIHYATDTGDAPPAADADADDVPDQVELTRDVMDEVWQAVVTDGGYTAVPSDGSRGGDSRFDVYLVDIGNDGIYGYCSPETALGLRASSYCVVDEDFSLTEFPTNSPTENLQVTGAHEFFHAVQFGYDYTEDGFFMENTATWVEDEVYDDVDDNRQYLSSSSLRRPGRPLDSSAAVYGNWIWWRYLTEQLPAPGGGAMPTLVRDAWDEARTTYSIRALALTLSGRGTSLTEQLGGFGVQNRRPGAADGYEEGAAYSPAPLGSSHTLTAGQPSIPWQRPMIDHLANRTVAFVPGAGLDNGSWQLRIRVDVPGLGQAPLVQVTEVPTSGPTMTSTLPLAGDGTGVVLVPFTSGTTRRVEVTLTNGGRDYDCSSGTSWACEGRPLDDNRVFAFRGVAVAP